MAGELIEADVVVVGAGPAGLVAAAELARGGLRVVVLDENATPGGQYFRRRSGAVRAELGDYRPAGTRLVDRAREAGAVLLGRTVVWGVADDGRTLLAVRDDVTSFSVRGRAVVLATGAHERSLPFPGWELPGVITPGAALHLATLEGVAVGERVVVGGSGPFLLPVACALLDVGVRELTVVEAATPYRPVLQALAHPRPVLQFARYRAKLARAGVPVRQGWRVASAHGEAQVGSVRLVRADGRAERTLAVDALAVAHGFRPNTELAALLGAELVAGAHDGRDVVRDGFGRTSVDGMVVTGETAGVAGVEAAQARGVLAAVAVSGFLGASGPGARPVRRARAAAARAEAFARFTDRLYPAQTETVVPSLPDHALVCRCEGVTAGELRAARAGAAGDLGGMKGLTRAGMGLCQGRQCAVAVEVLTRAPGAAPGPAVFTPRMPVKPVRIEALLPRETP